MAVDREPITVKQVDAAEMAGVSERTIRRWDRQGLVCGKTVRGVRLYEVAAINS